MATTRRSALSDRFLASVTWASGSLAAIVLVTLVSTRWYQAVWYFPEGGGLSLTWGQFTLAGNIAPAPVQARGRSHLVAGRVDPRIEWAGAWGSYGNTWYLAVPLWLPTVLLACLAGGAWRAHSSRRRERTGTCARCGYDRAGLATGAACPECGTTPRGAPRAGAPTPPAPGAGVPS